jgi:hypothetical protein
VFLYRVTFWFSETPVISGSGLRGETIVARHSGKTGSRS